MSVCERTVFGNIVFYCQMFDKWKVEVDEKLKEEKKKKLRQERRVEESNKDEKSRKQEDAESAYEKWYIFMDFFWIPVHFLINQSINQ